MKRKDFTIFVALLLIVGFIRAQQSQDSKSNNIFEALSTIDSTTHATVKIHQDKRVEQLLANKKSSGSTRDQATSNGYRVQVFSSNVQRTAKNEAFKIERQIRETFPDQTVYVNYSSPFWKVRVGDFTSQGQAQSLRMKLIEAFPDLRSEIYIVREQILISESK